MGAGIFEQSIDERRLPVVNMRDYREIPHVFSSFLIRHRLRPCLPGKALLAAGIRLADRAIFILQLCDHILRRMEERYDHH